MRTIRILFCVGLVAAAPAYAQDAAPTFAVNTPNTPQAFAAQASQPPRANRRFRVTRAVARVAREMHAQGLIRVPESAIHIDNTIAGGAVAGVVLGALALSNDCEPAPGKCPALKYLAVGAGAGAVVGAIASSRRDD